MKKALLIALVVLVIVTGVPLIVGMSGMACPDCGPAVMSGSACAVVLLSFGLFLALASELLRSRRERCLALLHVIAIERPPRLA